MLEKRRRFLNDVIGTSSFVRMELVQYGDVSNLEEEYRSSLNLEDGKFVSSICDRENKQGLLWEFNNWVRGGALWLLAGSQADCPGSQCSYSSNQ